MSVAIPINDTCALCLEDFPTSKQLDPVNEQMLQCRHRFHKNCQDYDSVIDRLISGGCFSCRAPVRESVGIERIWRKGKKIGSENSERIMRIISTIALTLLVFVPTSLSSEIDASSTAAWNAGQNSIASYLAFWSFPFTSLLFSYPGMAHQNHPRHVFGSVASFALGWDVGFSMTGANIGINGRTGFAIVTASLVSYYANKAFHAISNQMGVLGRQRHINQVISYISGACFVAEYIASRVAAFDERIFG